MVKYSELCLHKCCKKKFWVGISDKIETKDIYVEIETINCCVPSKEKNVAKIAS